MFVEYPTVVQKVSSFIGSVHARIIAHAAANYKLAWCLKCRKRMCLEEKEKDLTNFQSIKKLHEVDNHKGVYLLISAYSKARWMSVGVSKDIFWRK